MVAMQGCRLLMIVTALGLLAGCATQARESASQTRDDYFARQMPGLPDQWDPKMSRIDNPIRQLRSLHNPSEDLVRQALLAQYERWEGTPYRLGGDNDRGIDCSALVQNVFIDTFRLELPRSTDGQVHQGVAIERTELEAGDLVFFRPPGAYNHVGIYVGDGIFLHASASTGVRLSKLDSNYWRRHFWQARRPLEPTRLAQRAMLASQG